MKSPAQTGGYFTLSDVCPPGVNVAVSDDGDKDIETPNPVEWLLTVTFQSFKKSFAYSSQSALLKTPVNEVPRADSLAAPCGNLCNDVAVNVGQDDDIATKHRA